MCPNIFSCPNHTCVLLDIHGYQHMEKEETASYYCWTFMAISTWRKKRLSPLANYYCWTFMAISTWRKKRLSPLANYYFPWQGRELKASWFCDQILGFPSLRICSSPNLKNLKIKIAENILLVVLVF